MLVQYLITTVKKTKSQLLQLVKDANIKGNIIIGNQLQDKQSKYCFECEGAFVTVFNLTSVGVSKNRNFLLKVASAKYVVFLDDDAYFVDDMQSAVESYLSKNNYSAIRYNVVADNPERALKTIDQDKFVNFWNLRAFGVWGIFFKRKFLLDNKLFFDEKIGPGTKTVFFGEDSQYIHIFLKRNRIFQKSEIAFHIKQEESTWQGQNRRIAEEIVARGYNYKKLFGILALPFGILHFIKHKNIYTEISFFRFTKLFIHGLRLDINKIEI